MATVMRVERAGHPTGLGRWLFTTNHKDIGTVYLVLSMILPAFGLVSQIVPTSARKPLFGYASMVYAIASIAFLSTVVWGHHISPRA